MNQDICDPDHGLPDRVRLRPPAVVFLRSWLLAVLLPIALLLPLVEESYWWWGPGRVTLAVLGVTLLIRQRRRGIEYDERRVRVRRFFRTVEIPWEQVAGFSAERSGIVVHLVGGLPVRDTALKPTVKTGLRAVHVPALARHQATALAILQAAHADPPYAFWRRLGHLELAA